MKTHLSIISLLLAAGVHAQIYVKPGTAFLVRSGTVVSTDSLTLTPNVDMNLQGLAVQVSYTPITIPGTGSTIARVCNLISPLSFRGTVGLYYSNSQLNGNTAANLQLMYNNSTNNIVSTGSIVNTSTNYITQVFPTSVTLAKVSAIALGTPLDINLLNYSAKADGQRTRLEWTITNDQPDHFRIDRSVDGKIYQPLLTKKAVHQQAPEINYIAYDEHPLTRLNYYRLVIFDLAGKELDAGTRIVRFGSQENLFQISIFPNPVSDHLNVQFSSLPPQDAVLTLSDLSGRIIRSMPAGDTVMQLTLSGISSGTYLLSYRAAGQTETFKIEKL